MFSKKRFIHSGMYDKDYEMVKLDFNEICLNCGRPYGEHYGPIYEAYCLEHSPVHEDTTIAFMGYAYLKYYYDISNNKVI